MINHRLLYVLKFYNMTKYTQLLHLNNIILITLKHYAIYTTFVFNNLKL